MYSKDDHKTTEFLIRSITSKELNEVDFSRMRTEGLNEISRSYLNAVGEPYTLYAAITQYLLPGVIIDIGTLYGTSALAWTYSGHNVVTYDINNQIQVNSPIIEFRQENLVDDLGTHSTFKRLLKNCAAICVDTDPHAADKERKILDLVLKMGWSGPIVFDDIHLNRLMEFFWEDCQTKFNCLDLTNLGHATGTGIIFIEGRT